MTARFYWGGEPDSKKIHWLKWENITTSKRNGGLCFRRMKEFNKSLLAKQMWRLLSNDSCLASKALKARYYPLSSPQKQEIRGGQVTLELIYVSQEILKGAVQRIGDGRSVHVWGDKWLPNTIDGQIYKQQNFDMDPSLLVADLIDQD